MDLFDIAIAKKLSGGGGGGGGGSSASKKQINFLDYDGTIVDSYTASEWAEVTSLPENPSHDGLTSQGWNWTKAQIDAQLTELPSGDVWVGQMYVTESGDTEIDVRFADSARLSPYFSCAVNGTITIDWGDGATSTVSGTSLTSRQSTQHTYASVGDYTVTIHVNSGSWAFYGSSTRPLFNKDSTSPKDAHRVYASCVRSVRVGNDTYIGDYAFNYCILLECITIPSSVTSIGNYAFNYCYSLRSITIPNSVTSIGDTTFSSCSTLESITMPSSVTSIGVSAFKDTSLRGITIPNSVTSMGNTVFLNCYVLGSITIPSNVTSIGASAFNGCYGVGAYHIKPTTPPTLASTDAFKNIQSDCVIYVPSESLEAYKTATNWSTYASYMVGE